MIALRKHIGNLGQVTDQIHGCIKRAGHPFDQIFVNGFFQQGGIRQRFGFSFGVYNRARSFFT